jgi:ABC-type transporter Mla subunit MlaD
VGGGVAGASGDAASDAAAGVAGFVVPAIQNAVQQASGLNTQVAANSQQQSGYLSQMVDLLTQLVNNQPTATQTAKATSVEQSRFS